MCVCINIYIILLCPILINILLRPRYYIIYIDYHVLDIINDSILLFNSIINHL